MKNRWSQTDKCGDNRAFTLVELMVAMAIVGLIMTLMMSGLSAGIESWERGSAAIRNMEARAGVRNLLRRQLALASPVPLPDGDDVSSLFEGTGARLTFVTPYSMLDGPSELRRVDYFFEDGRFAYAEQFLFEYGIDGVAIPEAQVVASFEGMEFRYLGADREGRPAWLNEWERAARLPRAVQIRIEDDYLVVPLAYR